MPIRQKSVADVKFKMPSRTCASHPLGLWVSFSTVSYGNIFTDRDPKTSWIAYVTITYKCLLVLKEAVYKFSTISAP